ncbi:IS110 family transposase [Cellulomonas sp. McL0617]|uniref:IS110 family transposase n=1 Tax=Cellulomonas sp. McL0617 TaxID=3415675 RepID=UPI003CF53C37
MFAGIDTHKDTLAVAVVDVLGSQLAGLEVANTEVGFAQILELLGAHRVVRVGVEGSGNFGRAVAAHLSGRGVDVREVPTSMSSRERAARPGQGKTDEVDALAIARLAGREPGLPPARLVVGLAADLRSLLDYREDLVDEHHRLVNQVHAELTGLLPGYQHIYPHLKTSAQVSAVLELLDGDDRVRAVLTRRRLSRALEVVVEARAVHKQIAQMIAGHAEHVAAIYGAGPILAARFVAEIVDIERYPTRDAFASANGSAPLAASSGRTVRHRLNRGGNRRLNRALYVMAITQARADTEGRAYYARKRAKGKTAREAIRCLKRQLSDQVYKAMRADAAAAALGGPAAASTPVAA